MKVWELMQELSKVPAGAEVMISKGEKSFSIKDTSHQDWDLEGFAEKYPINLIMGAEDK